MHAEIRQRITQRLQEQNIDVYIACTPANVYYASGFQSSFIDLSWQMTGTDMVIVPADPSKPPAIVVSEYCENDARTSSDIEDIRCYGMWMECRDVDVVMSRDNDPEKQSLLHRPEQYQPEEIHALVRSILEDRGLAHATIGTDLALMKQGTAEWFRKTHSSNKIVDCESLLYDLRRIKHGGEIERLRKAAGLFEHGIGQAVSRIRPGQSLTEIRCNYEAGVVDQFRRDPGLGDYQGVFFFPHIGKGSNSVVKEGDIVKLDCGVKLDGYWSDCCRTFCLGKPDPLQRQIHDALLAGFKKGLSLLAPGRTMNEIYKEVLAEVRQRGMPNYSRGHFGHSIGMDDQTEEPPFIGPNESRLEPNMVLSIEVPYYANSVGGFNIEDMILITEDGYRNFNQLPHDLRDISRPASPG